MTHIHSLCMDVGGTEIKAAILERDQSTGEQKLLHVPMVFPALSDGTKEKILSNFIDIMEQVCTDLPQSAVLHGIGFAFPGPFDYENGISKMQNISKYDAIYDVNLREELLHRMQQSVRLKQFVGTPVCFVNDVAAFALGELHYGAAVHTEKAMFVCIGTGCGSAFSMGSHLVGEEVPAVPANGYIYPTPFLESCIDDYISKRGLEHLSYQMLGKTYDGLALARLVGEGNSTAEKCFRKFGAHLLLALEGYLDAYQPKCLVMGGQIIKSAALFTEPLSVYCKEKNIELHFTADTSRRSLQGLTTLFDTNS